MIGTENIEEKRVIKTIDEMSRKEKLEQAYWYSYLLAHMELAELLSPTPRKAMKKAALSVAKICPSENISRLAVRAQKDFFPSVWLERQRKYIEQTGMSMDRWYQQGFCCGELLDEQE